MQLQPFNPADGTRSTAIAALWNAACGPDLAISPALVAYNTQPATGSLQAGRLALIGDQPAGFVLATAPPADPATSPPDVGWIDAIAVPPAYQRQGVGLALLVWAEAWLAGQGCTTARLGGGLKPFAPGLPVELASEPFFQQRGYEARREAASVWDVARNLSDYPSDAAPLWPGGFAQTGQSVLPVRLSPATRRDAQALLDFLRRDFPGRWRFECEEFLRAGGSLTEYTLAWAWREDGSGRWVVDGFCRTRRAWRHGVEPLDRFFMGRLPKPWGQLGPIGVGQASRGQGLGAALLDLGLRRLRAARVKSCLIDWTDLVDFYAKFGFRPYREYRILASKVSP